MFEDTLKMQMDKYEASLQKKYYRTLPLFFKWIHKMIKYYGHGVRNPFDIPQYNKLHFFKPKEKGWKAFALENEQHPGYVFFYNKHEDHEKVLVYKFYEPLSKYEEQSEYSPRMIQWPGVVDCLEFLYEYSDETAARHHSLRRTLEYFKKEWTEDSVHYGIFPEIVYDSWGDDFDHYYLPAGIRAMKPFKDQTQVFFWINVIVTGLSSDYEEEPDWDKIEKIVKREIITKSYIPAKNTVYDTEST